MTVEFTPFLRAKCRHGRVVDIDGDVTILLRCVAEVGLEQQFVTLVDCFLFDRSLESAQCRCTGEIRFPESTHEGGVVFQNGNVVEIFVADK